MISLTLGSIALLSLPAVGWILNRALPNLRAGDVRTFGFLFGIQFFALLGAASAHRRDSDPFAIGLASVSILFGFICAAFLKSRRSPQVGAA